MKKGENAIFTIPLELAYGESGSIFAGTMPFLFVDVARKAEYTSAAVNALHLVHPAYAWIDPPADGSSLLGDYPSKKARRTPDEPYYFIVDIMVETYRGPAHSVKVVHCRGLFAYSAWLSSLWWKVFIRS